MGTGFSGYNRSSNITRAGVAESLISRHMKKESVSLIVPTAMVPILLLLLLLKVFQGKIILFALKYG